MNLCTPALHNLKSSTKIVILPIFGDISHKLTFPHDTEGSIQWYIHFYLISLFLCINSPVWEDLKAVRNLPNWFIFVHQSMFTYPCSRAEDLKKCLFLHSNFPLYIKVLYIEFHCHQNTSAALQIPKVYSYFKDGTTLAIFCENSFCHNLKTNKVKYKSIHF